MIWYDFEQFGFRWQIYDSRQLVGREKRKEVGLKQKKLLTNNYD